MKKLIHILLIMLACIASANAQTAELNSDIKTPRLNGHVFPTLNHFASSFVNTSLQANLGFGVTSPLKIDGLQIGEYELYSFEGQILFLDMEVQYQQRFNPWLALQISATMVGRVGTDMSTIMADGINTISGGKIGWLVRIKQTKKFNLSGNIQISNLNGSFINVKKYFEDVINDEPEPTLVNKVPSMSIGGGLMGAWAISRVFGLQFNAEGNYGESFNRNSDDAFFSIGINSDADFNPVHNVPVGIALGYTFTSAPRILMAEGGDANLLVGKVGYTGSDEFELGLQYTYYKINLTSVTNNPSLSAITLLLKFYF